MRSGNTMFRKMLEDVTGVSSGANFPTCVTASLAFFAWGFKGEYILDKKVWLKKSHHPYNCPFV